MTEYIEREALKKVLTRYLSAPHVQTVHSVGQGMRIAIKSCIELLDNEYAADVAPVRHAHWEEWLPEMSVILTGEEMLYTCSNCTAKYEDVEGMRYCPNCGAKMGGERKEKEKAMSIDEAIQHCEEMALCAKNGECGEEHRQLADG